MTEALNLNLRMGLLLVRDGRDKPCFEAEVT
jgi:hypothetical protein